MKTYIHARLARADRAMLEGLKKTTRATESQLVRRGLRLVSQELTRQRSALDVAGTSVGKFKTGPRDLARNKKHLRGFGE